MTESSLVNLGDLSKPATVLIEKISEAVGGICKPYQIVRIAKAEAEADLIRAQSEIKITDLHRRALTRFIEEEAIKQNNMEKIIQQALPLINEEASPENVEDDWIAHFFDQCRLTSDLDMQLIWSRILSGEANTPGTYSKRTVALLSTLDKSDAVLFNALCGFCWGVDETIIPLVYDSKAEVYTKRDINFASLNHLNSIGLITLQLLTGYTRTELPKMIFVNYHDSLSRLEFIKDSANKMDIGHVIFTNVGEELATICSSEPVEGFREYIHKAWEEMGYNVSE